jgi:hypothetical protein
LLLVHVAPLYLTSLVLSNTYILPTSTKKRKSNLKKLQGGEKEEKRASTTRKIERLLRMTTLTTALPKFIKTTIC